MKTITIIGLGYVGLPLAVSFRSKGFEVWGYDLDQERVNLINQGKFPFPIESENVDVRIKATTKPEECLPKSDYVIICVPTPVDEKNIPDVSFIEKASEIIKKFLKKGMTVTLESTTYPGTTDEIVKPILEESGLKAGEDFYLGYSPERIDPGSKKYPVEKIPKIVSGINKESLAKVKELYDNIIEKTIPVKNMKTAEAVKIVENVFRNVNISLVNELAILFEKMGINTYEVIDAASTKPFGFMPFYPGPGVGGHCFGKNTKIFLINDGHLKIKDIGAYVDSLNCKKKVVNDSDIFYPQNMKVLSFDMIKNRTSFKTVNIASKRKTKDLLRIKCSYNYKLDVTELHPVIIYDKGLKVKFAKDLKIGDKLVLNKILPSGKSKIKIDIIEHLNKSLIEKIRVKPKDKSFIEFKKIIDKNLRGNKRDYYRYNSFPLEKYLEIENLLDIKREDIFLCTGRGPSFKEFSSVIDVDRDFLRLIGYYISEGCITKDKSLRTGFTFNKNETEYIDDLKQILKKFDIDYSVYLSKRFDSYHIKVSSNLFGFLLKDILNCGTNCYNMQIPEMFFDLEKPLKKEILKGMFRGDGGVSWYSGKRKYKKGNKLFEHFNNTVEVTYFTSSKVLFQQLMLFMLNMEIVPKLAKREGYLVIGGMENVSKLKDWFLGEKKEKIGNYLKNMRKNINYKKVEIHKNYIIINVEKIEKSKPDYVYSMEVEGTNTLVTSNGIIAHNCIPVDPFYLSWKAKDYDVNLRFIELAGLVNQEMPLHVVELIEKNVKKDQKILILGVAFKKNVSDARNTPAKKIIEELKKRGYNFSYFDPFIKKFNGLVSEGSLKNALKGSDCAVVITDHDYFKDVNMDGKIVIDTRNFFKNPVGRKYVGLGK